MNRFITLIAVVLLCAFAASLSAQGRYPRKNKNTYKKANEQAKKAAEKQQKKAQNNAKKEAAAEEREAEKEEREARRNGDEEERPAIVGGEGADLPEPGEATEEEFKEEVLEGILDELGVTDEKQRKEFKKNVIDAWEDTEKEDKRWAGVYRRYEDDSEKLGDKKEEHTEKLAKIWEDSDEDLVKDEVLTEEQMKRWKDASEELRTKTNTDRYYEAKPASEPDVKEKKAEGED